MLNVIINGTEYALADTLRVAYRVQGQNNHKPYSKVFEEIGEAPLEKQIEILFCAFQVANPNAPVKFQQFLDYYLDNYKLRDVLAQVKEVIKGIMGPEDDAQAPVPGEQSGETTADGQGN